VYAEHTEDILLHYPDVLRFIQVKTRAATAGVWTAEQMCADGGEIDSLARAYACRTNGSLLTLEWVRGMPGVVA
jgi:hypothetical protein